MIWKCSCGIILSLLESCEIYSIEVILLLIVLIVYRRAKDPKLLRIQARCMGVFGFLMLWVGVAFIGAGAVLGIPGLTGFAVPLILASIFFVYKAWKYHRISKRELAMKTAVTTIARRRSSTPPPTGNAHRFQQQIPVSTVIQYPNPPPSYLPHVVYPAAPQPPTYYPAAWLKYPDYAIVLFLSTKKCGIWEYGMLKLIDIYIVSISIGHLNVDERSFLVRIYHAFHT